MTPEQRIEALQEALAQARAREGRLQSQVASYRKTLKEAREAIGNAGASYNPEKDLAVDLQAIMQRYKVLRQSLPSEGYKSAVVVQSRAAGRQVELRILMMAPVPDVGTKVLVLWNNKP